MKSRIVLLGPPASGKGTQAQRIAARFGIPAVSTGHLLRDEAAGSTGLGRRAASFTSKGQLAPDDLVLAVLKKWLGNGRESFVFDGFPRTLEQATILDPLLLEANIPLHVTLFLDCDLSTIQHRVLGRLTCSSCKSIFNIGLHIQSEHENCPKCAGKLERRADDTLEILEQRMAQYARKTEPLIAFYREKGILCKINASQESDAVFAEIEKELLQ